MKQYKWLPDFLAKLTANGIEPIEQNTHLADTLPRLIITAQNWGKTVAIAAINEKYRFAGLWAQDLGETIKITICLAHVGEHILLATQVDTANPTLPSITPHYPAADRFERHTRDLFGISFIDHPNQKRWTRHQAWTDSEFPLRKNFIPTTLPNTHITPPDTGYPFKQVEGTGVYAIPVGPVHAGIIEPGHFRFNIAGEEIITLEERLGYVHKGIEKLAEGKTATELLKLASRISGDSTVTYAWATCKACEQAFNIIVTDRALFIRAIMAERERIANHLGDFAGICNDVGFSFAYYQFMRLKELWLRLNAQIFGHRFMMDCLTIGGVNIDLNQEHQALLQQQCISTKQELTELYRIIESNASLHDRLKSTGILTLETATKFGALGYLGRASGCTLDLRHDAPYAPYDQLNVKVPTYSTGDVLARTRIRAQEILASLDLIATLLDQLPSGTIQTPWTPKLEAKEAIGIIEGWRGETLVFLQMNSTGLVERFFPRDPSWFAWPALEQLVHDNIVPDFPVCNKSVNGSYSGVDL